MITETGDVIALLCKTGGGGATRKTRTDDNNAVFTAVSRIDQLHVEFMAGPLLGERTGGNLGV